MTDEPCTTSQSPALLADQPEFKERVARKGIFSSRERAEIARGTFVPAQEYLEREFTSAFQGVALWQKLGARRADSLKVQLEKRNSLFDDDDSEYHLTVEGLDHVAMGEWETRNATSLKRDGIKSTGNFHSIHLQGGNLEKLLTWANDYIASVSPDSKVGFERTLRTAQGELAAYLIVSLNEHPGR